MFGIHITGDLFSCTQGEALMRDGPLLLLRCVDQLKSSGLTVVSFAHHQFDEHATQPTGSTVAVLLAESHLTIHTWPELRAVTLDVYVCNFSVDNSQKAESAFRTIKSWFAPQNTVEHRITRGSGPG